MINASEFVKLLLENDISYFTGVPDSQLKPFCDYITNTFGVGKEHIIAPNEGNAVALAAGYHLATGKIGLVYMQNSGLGNAVNPITSLIDTKVYAIPTVFLIGWRGEPGVHDEPQHRKQGEITLDLLKILDIEYYVITKDTKIEDIEKVFKDKFDDALKQGRSVAFVAKKGVFEKEQPYVHPVSFTLSREDAIKIILDNIGEDVVVSTTGKTSREIYEYRDAKFQDHSRDFLTVGSMGHASMIAFGIAQNKPRHRVWCLDGDGSILMHTGTMALIGSSKPNNFIHVLLNNSVHESVGGMPTVADNIDFGAIAAACGYRHQYKTHTPEGIVEIIEEIKEKDGPIFIEINVANGSRADLGRPKTTPQQNKESFMAFLKHDS